MKNIILGIGDLDVSSLPGSTIKTFALGSCVAVIIMDPKTRTVGMAHVALPDSKGHDASHRNLGYFADKAIPGLLKKIRGNGKGKGFKPGGLIVKIAGGAKVMDPNNVFEIGKRNIMAIKKHLWKFGLGPLAEDIGGSISRTVAVSVDTGEVVLSSGNQRIWKL